MARRRGIYAFLLVVIYIAASTLSSISLLVCDHHHHHHHHVEECHRSGCTCHGLVFDRDCCDHHHPILGDNHTDYIDSSNRSVSRTLQEMPLILAHIVVPTLDGEQSLYQYTLFRREPIQELGSLRPPHTLAAGLRAPPYLA